MGWWLFPSVTSSPSEAGCFPLGFPSRGLPGLEVKGKTDPEFMAPVPTLERHLLPGWGGGGCWLGAGQLPAKGHLYQ